MKTIKRKLKRMLKVPGENYCEECKKQFKNKRGLNQHYIAIHVLKKR